MNQVRFFALGGLAENGKNMFVIEIDREYFILDAGIKYPSSEIFGVDEIIPDYKILKKVKKNIKGIFLSHAHEDHIAALPHILKDLDVPIYATNFTMELIKDNLIEADLNPNDYQLNVINQSSIIKFKNARVTFFNTTHSIPESVGIAVHTTKGSIVYTSEFTFDQSSDVKYQTDFQKISELTDKKVLAVLMESVGSSQDRNTHANLELTHSLNSIFANANGRVLVSLFSSDLLKIQRVIDIALMHNKKLAIIGRKAQRIIDIAIKEGYLDIPKGSLKNLRFIDEKNKNDDKDLVALVTGSRHEPFYMLQRMCRKSDRLINITEEDTVVIMTSPVPGTEKMAARTIDVLSRSDAKVEIIPNELLTSSHANADEIKMFLNILKPQYVIPVIGEYRHQYGVRKIAMELGYEEDSVFLMDNGDVLTFDEKPYVSRGELKINDIYIDGTDVGDVNDHVLRDRELLAGDGALLLIAHVDPRSKKIVGEVEVVSRGFVYIKESQEIIDQIREEFVKTSEKHLKGKYINWNEYKRDIRNTISRFVYQTTRRSPITIPVIISTENNK